MTGLTHKQSELLGFLEFFMARSGGVSPSFEEMAVAVGLKSKSGIHRLVSGLVERGLIRRLPNRARAIEIVTQGNPPSGFSTDDLVAELARRGIATRSPADTTPPGLNLPEPRTEPPVSGSGPSVHSSFHAAEIANV